MTYTLCISNDGEIIVRLGVTADEALAIVGRAIPKTADVAETEPQRQKPKSGQKGKRGPSKTEKDLADEADQKHGRSRIDPAITQQVEDMLIAGESVAAIHEKVDVSASTIYVIKNRLRKEGRLPA